MIDSSWNRFLRGLFKGGVVHGSISESFGTSLRVTTLDCGVIPTVLEGFVVEPQ